LPLLGTGWTPPHTGRRRRRSRRRQVVGAQKLQQLPLRFRAHLVALQGALDRALDDHGGFARDPLGADHLVDLDPLAAQLRYSLSFLVRDVGDKLRHLLASQAERILPPDRAGARRSIASGSERASALTVSSHFHPLPPRPAHDAAVA